MWNLWRTSVVACHCHSTHAPYSSSSTSTGRCYQDRQANLPKSSALWEIAEHWIESTLISLWISAFKGLSCIKKRTISHLYLYSYFHSNFSRNISSNGMMYSKKLVTICFWYCSQQLWLAETWCCFASIVLKGKMSDLHIKYAELLSKGIIKFKIHYSWCHGYECCAVAKELNMSWIILVRLEWLKVFHVVKHVIFTARALFLWFWNQGRVLLDL